jgi:type I restriction enzyme, S subunit
LGLKSKQILSNDHLYFGIIPDDWKWKTIEEIKGNGKSLVSGPFGSNIGKRFFRPTGVPIIRGNNLKHGKFIDSGFVFVDDEKAEELKNCVALEDDIIFTAAGTIGQVGIIPKNGKYRKYIISNKQLRLRLDTAVVNPLFAFYWFSSNKMQEYLILLNVGSALPLLTLRELKSVPIPIPCLTIQNKIVIILNNFYKKIVNLQNQNKILEQTTQTIFKSWFVDFDGVTEWDDSELGKIPREWTVSTLSNLTSFDIGGAWGKEIQDKDFNYPSFCIRGKNIPEIIHGDDSKTLLLYGKKSILEKRKLCSHDMVIEISGGSPTQLTGRSLLITEKLLGRFEFPLFPASFCKLIRFKDKKFSFFIYFLLRFIYDMGIISQYETGTTAIKNFQYTIFSNDYKFVLPRNMILKKFNQTIHSILNMIDNNTIKIQSLTKTRDILLPKLMSGEIRV